MKTTNETLNIGLPIDNQLVISDSTYELVGPKIQGNPYNFTRHILIRHGSYCLADCPRDFDSLKQYLWQKNQGGNYCEGVVFHHPDGRMAKIRFKDFDYSVHSLE
jgi:hypothetical protein